MPIILSLMRGEDNEVDTYLALDQSDYTVNKS